MGERGSIFFLREIIQFSSPSSKPHSEEDCLSAPGFFPVIFRRERFIPIQGVLAEVGLPVIPKKVMERVPLNRLCLMGYQEFFPQVYRLQHFASCPCVGDIAWDLKRLVDLPSQQAS